MNLTFLAPTFLWALLGIPLVILLHFVRTRKRRQDVSALFLWRRAFELARARRRFSPSWLLLAQLLFIALAALALAQPQLNFEGPPDRVLVVDASASMAARDSDGVRLEKAVRRAGELIARNGRVAVVRAGLDATVVQAPTGEAVEARRALEGLVAADRGADLVRALALARSIATGAEIHLFSDRPPPAGESVSYHPVAGDGMNLGISTFDVGIQQAYVAVVSTSPRPQEVVVEILHEDRLLSQATLLVPAGGQANATFPLGLETGIFEARLKPPDWDALGLDDVAFAGSEDLVVVLDIRSTPLVRALDAIPGVRWRVTSVADRVPADVRILTGVDPSELDRGRYLLFPEPSPEAQYKTVQDWDQSDPLLRFVDLREAVVGVDLAWNPAGEGWEILARTGDLTPVLLRLDSPDLEMIWAAFHPSQTDIVFRPAFPALMANILRAFRGEDRLPLGSPLPATADGRSPERAEVPGVYRVEGRGYTSSLLSAQESRLPPPASAIAPASGAGQGRAVARSRSAAPWLVLVALLVLVTEWLLWARSRGEPWLAFERGR